MVCRVETILASGWAFSSAVAVFDLVVSVSTALGLSAAASFYFAGCLAACGRGTASDTGVCVDS